MKKGILCFVLFTLITALLTTVVLAGENGGIESEVSHDDQIQEVTQQHVFGHNSDVVDNFNKLREEHEEKRNQILESHARYWENVDNNLDSSASGNGTIGQDTVVTLAPIVQQSTSPQTIRDSMDKNVQVPSYRSAPLQKSSNGGNGFILFFAILVIIIISFNVGKALGTSSKRYSSQRVNGKNLHNSSLSFNDFIFADDDSHIHQQMVNEQNRLFMEQVQRDMETAQFMHDHAVDMHHQAVEMHDQSFNDFNNFF